MASKKIEKKEKNININMQRVSLKETIHIENSLAFSTIKH
jgi:hypothetical protein